MSGSWSRIRTSSTMTSLLSPHVSGCDQLLLQLSLGSLAGTQNFPPRETSADTERGLDHKGRPWGQ